MSHTIIFRHTPENEREERVRKMMNRQGKVFRWHSISCACEQCLDADTASYIYGSTMFGNFNMEGLQP